MIPLRPLRARPLAGLAVAALWLTGCALFRSAAPDRPTRSAEFEPLTITGDLELAKLNDEELYAAGTAAFAAEDWRQTARYLGRLADFFPQSAHRREALSRAGAAHARLGEWAEAHARFSELSDPQRGTGEALDAAFGLAEALYHLDRHEEAAAILQLLVGRADLPPARHMESLVQQGICELEAGRRELAEATLRDALDYGASPGAAPEVGDYFPAQAHFFLGEIYRLHYEDVPVEPSRGVDLFAKHLEDKAELLLSAQGHYLRSIRVGNGHWATAAGARIGALYQDFHDRLVSSAPPPEVPPEEADLYRAELRKRVRVLLTKAVRVYEETLDAAVRVGVSGPFIDQAKQGLEKVKALLVADAEDGDEGEDAPADAPSPAAADPKS